VVRCLGKNDEEILNLPKLLVQIVDVVPGVFFHLAVTMILQMQLG
jgi:hypothetical protein